MNRTNKQITSPIALVVEEDGNKLGAMPIAQALALAETAGKDLIEVATNSGQSVCKIMDYSKFLYEQKKAQKQPKQPEEKEFRFGINIGDHDLEVKARQIMELLAKKHPIRIVVRFRGREITRKESGQEVITKLKQLITTGIWGEVKEEDKTLFTTIRKK